jgi:hypothetical protein
MTITQVEYCRVANQGKDCGDKDAGKYIAEIPRKEQYGSSNGAYDNVS